MRATLFLLVGSLFAQGPTKHANAPIDPARAFFATGAITRLAIDLPDAEREQLKAQPRQYVRCAVRVDGKTTWAQVGLKLKGSAGSYRELEDRPGITLKLDKFGEEQRFHGLAKFHLNNAVQDDTWLHEWIGGEIFTAAGLPAPRVAHAHVSLNGRELGLYVLRESYDKQFLQRLCGRVAGNLYDGGFCQDLDADLERDAGDGPTDRSDLRKLVELCRATTDPQRFAKLEQQVDVKAFLDFAAIEAMLGHWDGYCQNRNNYRVWFEPALGRACFLPHGMDQLFGDADATVLAHPHALVAGTVMENPEWRRRYRQRLRELLPLLQPDRWQSRLQAMATRLQAELKTIDPAAATAHAEAVRGLVDRMAARYRSLAQQVVAPEPKPLPFPAGKPVALRDWHPAPESDHVLLGRKDIAGVQALRVQCEGDHKELRKAAWRTSVLLARGRYRLTATARCDGLLTPPKVDEGDFGGLRLQVDGNHSEALTGDANWRTIACEFEVGEFQRDVELSLCVQAIGGRAWFRCDSLQLSKVKE